ncbi:4a-hydroxytetrahydrobiopterin dehydratase [Candidatus Woesearchaeota archaeon]|nr:4a-hydroxytetrahydrobiopterin dehydratase [Candidatus Woesearchaeota archaeon]
MKLANKRCVPCSAGTPPLKEAEISRFMKEVPLWHLKGRRLCKKFKFKDFIGAMKFVSSMAEIAESEDHHPDFSVHYNKVEVEIWTHAINGLSENDFILAARIDGIK